MKSEKKRKRGAFGSRFGFSALEEQVVRELWEASKRSNTPIKSVAEKLRITEPAVRMALYRLRIRYQRALDFIEIYRNFKKKLPRRKYL